MKIHFPNSAFLGNIDTFLHSFSPADETKLEVTFDKKWSSVHPVVLSMTAALGLSMKQKGAEIMCEQPEAKSKHYLESMGLIKILGLSPFPICKHEPAGRFIPITQIRNSNELTFFIREMIPLLHTKPNQAEPINYVMSELVRNVFEHSKSQIGAVVCAQYFKKTNRVSIGVADLGVGIKRTIEVSHEAPTDLAAINLALMPGVTGTTKRIGGTELNAGAGLFFIKSIAKVNRDFFVIYSGNAMYKLLKEKKESIKLYANPKHDHHSERNDLPYWTGTAVGIDISVEQNQDFSALLDLIRKVYRLDIRERTRERFKKARFI